jgi:predicted kinase
MGTGKSTLSEQLAFELGLAIYSSDTIRKQMAGLPPDKPARDGFNEGLYDRQSNVATYDELHRRAEQELKKGSSVIIDACFTRQDQRAPFAALAKKHSVPLVILNVACNDVEIKRRLQGREATGPSISDGRQELFAQQKEAFQPPLASEGILITLNATEPTMTLVDAIYTRLASC